MRPIRMLPTVLLLALIATAAPASEIAPEDPAPVARLLAGLASDGTPATDAHAAALEESWAALEERHLAPMRSWAEAELRPLLPSDTAPLFYPFGGPDLVSAMILRPEASSWILVGLEPPGRVADPASMAPEDLARELPRVRAALDPIVDAGYFVKKGMVDGFESEAFSGILPLLLVFVVRDGAVPLAVEPVAPGPDGTLVEAEAGRGVRIRIETADGDPRDVVYLRQDLGDEGLAQAPEFLAWLDHIGPWDTWIKAGHYLLHEPGFVRLRGLLLDGSRTLLQDDSAVPWRYFDPAQWDRTLFGVYGNLPAAYRKYHQSDLSTAYADADADPLPFAIGYHARLGGGPLILLRRSADAGPSRGP